MLGNQESVYFWNRATHPILTLDVESTAFLANEKVEKENEQYHRGAAHPMAFTLPWTSRRTSQSKTAATVLWQRETETVHVLE